MSVNISPLNLVRVIDPRCDVNARAHREYGVLDGASEITFKTLPSNNFNNSTVSFIANPPNSRIYVSRRAFVEMTFELIFTGTCPAGTTLLQAQGMASAPGVSSGTTNYDAPRAYPMSQITSACSVRIGNDNISQNIQAYFRALTRFQNPTSNQDGEFSLTPSMLDQFQQYPDGDGYNRNPLAGYGDNVAQCPRGGFWGSTITANPVSDGVTPITARVALRVVEPIYLSPFLFGAHEGNEQAFIGIETLQLEYVLGGRGNGQVVGANKNIVGLIGGLWSHSDSSPSVFTSASANLTSATSYWQYLSPDITQPLPSITNYSYYESNYLPTTNVGPVASGLTTTLQTNTIQLKSIPNRIYAWVSARDQDFNITSSDCYWSINQVQVSFDNRDALLSNASSYDIYLMALRAGFNGSYLQWSSKCGAVMCLQFGLDVPLLALQAPGLRGNWSFQLQVQTTNITGQTETPTLSILVINEGVMTIDNMSVYRSVGVLSSADILSTKEMPPVPYRASLNVYGGGFWDSVKSFVSKIARPALNVAKAILPSVAPQYAPLLGAVDDLATAHGVGMARLARARKKQQAKGGAMITRAQLQDLMSR
jgi:hypothetical protein